MKPTLDNIDQWLFDAMEGNLSPVQQQLLEEFIAQHPDLDLEADAWSLSTYSAAPITFEPKAALYRKKRITYKHFAAAAAILLLLLAVKSIFSPQTTPTTHLSATKPSSKSVSAPSDPLAPQPVSSSSSSSSSSSGSNISPTTLFAASSIASSSISFSSSPDLTSSASTAPLTNKLATLRTLTVGPVTGYRTDLRFESLAGIETNIEVTNNLRWPALARLSQFAQKELGLSNNQSYDLLLPGKSNIDANISSVGTLSQTRFQSTSIARSANQTAQSIIGQQFSLDGYSRSLRAGLGMQAAYKQYAQGAISDYEIGLIAAPKIAVARRFILEPAARLRMGARYASATQLQQVSFIEFENADLRLVQIDSTQAIGRRLFYKDLDLSLAIQTPILFASAQLENAFQHFDYAMGNEQQPSNYRAPQQLTLSLGTQYAARNEKMRISPYIQFRSNRLQTQYLAGLQLNVNKWQLGFNISDNKQYQAALGYFGKHSAVFVQSCQQQLLTLNQPSYYHQVSFRIYSQPSRKARRYIDLS
jgi:hypothetical protein